MVKEKVYGSFDDFRYHARLRRALSSVIARAPLRGPLTLSTFVIARLPFGKPWQSLFEGTKVCHCEASKGRRGNHPLCHCEASLREAVAISKDSKNKIASLSLAMTKGQFFKGEISRGLRRHPIYERRTSFLHPNP